ncbi:MAG TPA: sialate O-acetylesterase [Erythrobacter sp.]|nr:sialate O-acetylesterase [Erythrobacter sp.]
MRTLAFSAVLLSTALPCAAAAQSLGFGPLISDGAVFQRGRPVIVTGTATPGAAIEVKLGEAKRHAIADAAGEWRAEFPSLQATTGLALTASSATEALTVRNLAVGDVFLCSGQSNMQWAMEDTALPDNERRMPVDKTISLLSVPIATARVEQRTFASPAKWSNAFAGSGDFSAVCLIAGRAIANAQKVPVGLIDSSMGGTPIEAWLPYDGLQAAGGADEGLVILDAFRTDLAAAEVRYGGQLDALWKMPPPAGQPAGRPRMGYANLFNAMIAPLGNTPLAGVLWYQGENNTNRDGAREAYRRQLTALLASWRARFGAELPWVIVQLAPFGRLTDQPGEHNWAEVREAQRMVAEADPLAEMVTTVDVGERLDIHPPLKKPVGQRAAAAMAFLRYGGKADALGPRPLVARRAKGEVVIAMTPATGPLMAASWGRPGPFMLCDSGVQPTCTFADARLAASGIAVTIPAGFDPALVRYCWGAAPICNVFDTDQRPLPPFELPVTNEEST